MKPTDCSEIYSQLPRQKLEQRVEIRRLRLFIRSVSLSPLYCFSRIMCFVDYVVSVALRARLRNHWWLSAGGWPDLGSAFAASKARFECSRNCEPKSGLVQDEIVKFNQELDATLIGMERREA